MLLKKEERKSKKVYEDPAPEKRVLYDHYFAVYKACTVCLSKEILPFPFNFAFVDIISVPLSLSVVVPGRD